MGGDACHPTYVYIGNVHNIGGRSASYFLNIIYNIYIPLCKATALEANLEAEGQTHEALPLAIGALPSLDKKRAGQVHSKMLTCVAHTHTLLGTSHSATPQKEVQTTFENKQTPILWFLSFFVSSQRPQKVQPH